MNLELKKLKKLESVIASTENILLVTSFTIMIVLGTIQVLLRNTLNTGIEWADIFVRALVLWIGFLGASLATRRSRHINIDIFSKLITNPKLSNLRKRIVNIISLFIACLLFKASFDFLFMEMDSGMTAFLGIPTWVIFIIVPISMFLICVRLLIHSITNNELEIEDKAL